MRRIIPLCATIAAFAISAALCAALSTPAAAQSSYDRGYSDGYDQNFPLTGTPDSITEYGSGFLDGQYGRDDDERHLLEQNRRFEECLAAGGTDCDDK